MKKTPCRPVKKTAKKAVASKPTVASPATAKGFIEALQKIQSDQEREKIQRYFKSGEGQYGEGDEFMGVRMGQLFALAKKNVGMTPDEIEKLMESRIHEVRAGAMSIMDKQARDNKTPEARRKELFDLYMRRHDRINNWDLVDVSAIYVVGRYLYDYEKPRNILYKLARSKNTWERRTAIVSTAYFLKKGEVTDTFKIAGMLLKDKEDLLHKAAGGWIRQAGKQDRERLLEFLDEHAAVMPRTFLRTAIEHLDKKQKAYYMGLKA